MAAILVAGLTACTTPQVALDQADNTVRLLQNLQNELTRYQGNVKLSAQRRLKSVERLDTGTSEIALDLKFSAYLDTESGVTSELAARERIRDASDTYAKLIAEQDKAQAELAARLAAIVKGLPSPAEKLQAVQMAMAELGTELSASERVAIVTKFLVQATCIVDQSAQAASAAGCTSSSTPEKESKFESPQNPRSRPNAAARKQTARKTAGPRKTPAATRSMRAPPAADRKRADQMTPAERTSTENWFSDTRMAIRANEAALALEILLAPSGPMKDALNRMKGKLLRSRARVGPSRGSFLRRGGSTETLVPPSLADISETKRLAKELGEQIAKQKTAEAVVKLLDDLAGLVAKISA